MKRLVIEEEKIIHNLEVIGEKSGGAPLIAVLKANAYGLGMLPMADLLRRQGVKRFGVTEPEDAVALRDGGFLDEEILMLRSTAVKEDIEKILSSTATAAIGSYDAAVALNGMAEEKTFVFLSYCWRNMHWRQRGLLGEEVRRSTGMGAGGYNISLGKSKWFSLAGVWVKLGED